MIENLPVEIFTQARWNIMNQNPVFLDKLIHRLFDLIVFNYTGQHIIRA